MEVMMADSRIKDNFIFVSTLIVLILVTLFMALSGFLNLPMSILYADLLSFVGNHLNALLATIIASNIGAIFSPLGALAGIMWMRILKDHDVSFSFARFVKYGSLISIPALFAALGGLFIL